MVWNKTPFWLTLEHSERESIALNLVVPPTSDGGQTYLNPIKIVSQHHSRMSSDNAALSVNSLHDCFVHFDRRTEGILMSVAYGLPTLLGQKMKRITELAAESSLVKMSAAAS